MALHERPLQCEKVTIWCAVSAAVIIGLYFFEDGNERAVTVNGKWYWHMLQTFRGALNRDDIWFLYCQRHTAIIEKFLPRMHNFSVWGYQLAGLIPRSNSSWLLYVGTPQSKRVSSQTTTLSRIWKNRIQDEVQELNETPGLLQSVMNNFSVRLQQVIRYQGDHLKCVILKNKDFPRNWIIQATYCVIFLILSVLDKDPSL